MESNQTAFARALAFASSVQAPLLKLPLGENAGRAAGLSKKQAATRYPTRMSRYLIPYAWMKEKREELGRPLRVCEIGVGSGQMKKFVDFMEKNAGGGGDLYSSWHGYDVALKHEALKAAGYDQIEDFNADGEFAKQFSGYDLVLLLHVLEHLKDPEASVRRLVGTFDAGTLLLGGVPSAPEPLAKRREIRLRKKYLPGGHWCKFSEARVCKMLDGSGLESKETTGAFLVRWSGFFLENHAWWLKANLVFAHLFPSWPGETYFRAAKGGKS